MNKSLLVQALMMVAVGSMTACSDHRQPTVVYQQAPAGYQQAPVQYQQAPGQYPQGQAPVIVQEQQGGGTGTALIGAAAIGTAAYLAGKNSANNAPAQTNVYHAPAPAAPVVAPAPMAQVAPVTRPTSAPVVAPAPVKAPTVNAPVPKPLYNLQPTKVVPPRTVSASSSKPVSLSKR
jgi:hypothetical protein